MSTNAHNDNVIHNEPYKKKIKLTSGTTSQLKNMRKDPVARDFRKQVQQCCATNDLKRVMDLYRDYREQDRARIESGTFANILSLCDGLGERGLHVGTPKHLQDAKKPEKLPDAAVSISDRQRYATEIRQHMQERSMPLTETSYSALMRLYCRAGDLDRAKEILRQAEQTPQCQKKLRLYAPLLTAYCANDEPLQACRVWKQLADQSLALTEAQYLSLLECADRTRTIELMKRVLADLAEDVLVPSRDTTRAIVAWFASDAEPRKDPELACLLSTISVPHQQEPSPSMGPVTSPTGFEIHPRVGVDPATGQLTGLGHRLGAVTLSEMMWQSMQALNDTIVTQGQLPDDVSQHQGGRKGKKRALNGKDLDERRHHWTRFQDFCVQHKPVDVVMDGANVGYYEQNFASAPRHVNWRQVQRVVEHVEAERKSLLIFLHARHFSPKMLPTQYRPMVQSWRERGLLYQTPHGMNDDWFWMHAALHFRACILTNDEMRDHHFQMLAPRSFLRWKERHQIHFSLEQQLVVLEYPEVYSRRIQRVGNALVIPHPKRGDENRFLDGAHVEDEQEEETYACVRPKLL